MKTAINREIYRRIERIFLVITFTIISYFVLTNSRLATYASVVAQNDTANYDLQVLYGKEEIDSYDRGNLLDKGTLSIKNPNNHVVTANVNFKISDTANLDDMDIIINNKPLDKDKKQLVDNYYIIPIENNQIESYEDVSYNTEIYGDPYKMTAFNYDFDITESFYN